MPPLPQHYCPVCDRVHDVDLHTGKCHVCKRGDAKISYCPGCEHWMDSECRGDLWSRSWAGSKELVKKFLGLKSKDCCGPTDGPLER